MRAWENMTSQNRGKTIPWMEFLIWTRNENRVPKIESKITWLPVISEWELAMSDVHNLQAAQHGQGFFFSFAPACLVIFVIEWCHVHALLVVIPTRKVLKNQIIPVIRIVAYLSTKNVKISLAYRILSTRQMAVTKVSLFGIMKHITYNFLRSHQI